MANTHRIPEQWQQIFAQHASSGLQILAFCKQQHITPSSFYAWRKRLADTPVYPITTGNINKTNDNKPDWVNIIPEQQISSPNWDIELA